MMSSSSNTNTFVPSTKEEDLKIRPNNELTGSWRGQRYSLYNQHTALTDGLCRIEVATRHSLEGGVGGTVSAWYGDKMVMQVKHLRTCREAHQAVLDCDQTLQNHDPSRHVINTLEDNMQHSAKRMAHDAGYPLEILWRGRHLALSSPEGAKARWVLFTDDVKAVIELRPTLVLAGGGALTQKMVQHRLDTWFARWNDTSFGWFDTMAEAMAEVDQALDRKPVKPQPSPKLLLELPAGVLQHFADTGEALPQFLGHYGVDQSDKDVQVWTFAVGPLTVHISRQSVERSTANPSGERFLVDSHIVLLEAGAQYVKVGTGLYDTFDAALKDATKWTELYMDAWRDVEEAVRD